MFKSFSHIFCSSNQVLCCLIFKVFKMILFLNFDHVFHFYWLFLFNQFLSNFDNLSLCEVFLLTIFYSRNLYFILFWILKGEDFQFEENGTSIRFEWQEKKCWRDVSYIYGHVINFLYDSDLCFLIIYLNLFDFKF